MAIATELSPESELKLAEFKAESIRFFDSIDQIKKALEDLTRQVASLDARMTALERTHAL